MSQKLKKMTRDAEINGQKQYREFKIDQRSINKEERTCELSFSSEAAVERWFGFEILDHKPTSCVMARLNGNAALLVNHNPDDQVGVVISASIGADRKGRAVVKFSRSERGEEVWQDVLDGIRTLVSVGYIVHESVTESVKDGVETVRVTRWEPFEVSLVAVPADTTVGVGRGSDSTQTQKEQPKENMNRKLKLLDPNTDNNGGGTTAAPAAPVVPAAPAHTVSVEAERALGVQNERKRVSEIQALGSRSGVRPELTIQAINEGWTADQFRTQIFETRFPSAKPVATNDPEIGLSEKEKRQYSLVRAISRVANKQPLDGLEAEASAEVAKRNRRDPQGFFVPSDITQHRQMITPDIARGMRALSAEVAHQGGYFVQESVLGDSMIELLRNRMVVSQLGVMNLTGLVGDIAIPRQNAAAQAYWLGESDEVPAADQTIGQIALRPHRLAGNTAYTKQLLVQSSVSVELFVRADLMTILAIEKDRVAINGTGAAGQPLGIINTTGVNSVTFGAAPTWAKVVEFETKVAQANADKGSLAYLTTPGVRGAWKTTQKATNYPVYIWGEGASPVNGYRAEATNQVPLNKVIFGNWNDLVLADWDGIDVVVDPYTLASKGQVRIVILLMTDVGVRHALSFSVSADAGNQ